MISIKYRDAQREIWKVNVTSHTLPYRVCGFDSWNKASELQWVRVCWQLQKTRNTRRQRVTQHTSCYSDRCLPAFKQQRHTMRNIKWGFGESSVRKIFYTYSLLGFPTKSIIFTFPQIPFIQFIITISKNIFFPLSETCQFIEFIL